MIRKMASKEKLAIKIIEYLKDRMKMALNISERVKSVLSLCRGES